VERLACDARLDVRTQGTLKRRHLDVGEYIWGGELCFGLGCLLEASTGGGVAWRYGNGYMDSGFHRIHFLLEISRCSEFNELHPIPGDLTLVVDRVLCEM
jgi:hypothetical protein